MVLHCEIFCITEKLRHFRFTETLISSKVRYTWFFRTFWRRIESTSRLPYALVSQFTVSFPTSEFVINAFLTMAYFSWHYDYVPLWYVALRMEITYGIYVSFLFVTVMYFLFLCNYVIYLFNVLTIFDDVRMLLYFGSFELRMEMTWKLLFVFLCRCDVFFISLQLRYLFVSRSYVFGDIRKRYYFGTFDLHLEITLQLRFIFVRYCNVFFITSQLRYLFVQCSYLSWWR